MRCSVDFACSGAFLRNPIFLLFIYSVAAEAIIIVPSTGYSLDFLTDLTASGGSSEVSDSGNAA